MRRRSLFRVSGGHGGGVTPVPISNTEVKPSRADDTAWATGWESRSPPGFIQKASCLAHEAFCIFQDRLRGLEACLATAWTLNSDAVMTG